MRNLTTSNRSVRSEAPNDSSKTRGTKEQPGLVISAMLHRAMQQYEELSVQAISSKTQIRLAPFLDARVLHRVVDIVESMTKRGTSAIAAHPLLLRTMHEIVVLVRDILEATLSVRSRG